jgi:uncharacterized protein
MTSICDMVSCLLEHVFATSMNQHPQHPVDDVLKRLLAQIVAAVASDSTGTFPPSVILSVPRDNCRIMSTLPNSSKKRRRQSVLSAHRGTDEKSLCSAFTGPLVVFAHGAGAGSSSQFMVDWAERISVCLSSPVHTFDFSYLAGEKRGAPPAMPKLVKELLTAVQFAQKQFPHAAQRGVILAGKSMGSRAAMYLAESDEADALALKACLCFGYPIGNDKGSDSANSKERFALAERASLPVMFVHGTRDRIASIARIRSVVDVRNHESASSTVLRVVESGDHSLTLTKSWLSAHSTTQATVDEDITNDIVSFVNKLRNPVKRSKKPSDHET